MYSLLPPPFLHGTPLTVWLLVHVPWKFCRVESNPPLANNFSLLTSNTSLNAAFWVVDPHADVTSKATPQCNVTFASSLRDSMVNADLNPHPGHGCSRDNQRWTRPREDSRVGKGYAGRGLGPTTGWSSDEEEFYPMRPKRWGKGKGKGVGKGLALGPPMGFFPTPTFTPTGLGWPIPPPPREVPPPQQPAVLPATAQAPVPQVQPILEEPSQRCQATCHPQHR